MKTVIARCAVLSLALVLIFSLPPVVAQIATSQYDNSRTGATTTETILTPQNVNAKQFGKLGAFRVDGAVFAQPLFVPAVEIPGKGKHDVIFVATEHDSVYAFDAGRPNDPPLWRTSFLDDKNGVTTVSAHDVRCPFIKPEVGITSTPVIDLKTGTIYVLARTMIGHTLGSNEYFQNLHALAITTGAEKFSGPKLISATATGKGDGSENGHIKFNALRQNPRAALLLVNNSLYLTFASSCDVNPYHGWVMAYDSQSLEQKATLNVTPDGNEGGIWGSDTGPAADTSGNVYIPTGNGTFNAASGGKDYGDTELKLAPGNSLTILDYFTPHDQAKLSDDDLDLGSAGPILLPDQTGPHPHLLVQPAKGSKIYVIDRDHMGKFQSGSDAVVQSLSMPDGGFGAMAYWNQHLFFAASGDSLRDYSIENGQLKLSAASNIKIDSPGATPSISSNGGKDAIVWAVANPGGRHANNSAVLYAFDATNIKQPIYTSEQNSQRDRAATGTRFVIPIVASGHVYFGGVGEVEVYGLLP